MDRAGLVEQALFFAMGFLAACLVAIVGIPAVSRRAMRLSEARARFRAPASEEQVIAQRDALRAQSAVDQARLERRLVLAEDASNQLRVAVGRQSAKILVLEATSAEQASVIVDQRAEIARGESDRRDLESGLGASQIALDDAFAQRDRAAMAEAAATVRQSELEAQASRDRARIAILAARGENMEGRLEDLSRSAKSAAEKAEMKRAQSKDELAGQSAEVRRLEGRLRDAILQNEHLSERLSRGGVSLEESRRRLTELESRLSHSEQAREEALLENGRQLAALAEREVALRVARTNAVELEARLAALAANALAQESAKLDPAQSLAVAQALGESETVQTGIAAPAASVAEAGDDAALREAIDRLGHEVSRLFDARKSVDQREDHSPGGRPFGRRKTSALVEPSIDERHGFADGAARRAARSLAPDR